MIDDDDDDQDDEDRWPPRADILGELAERLRAKHGEGDIRARLAGKRRPVAPEAMEAAVANHWKQRAKDIVGAWLDRLNDDELEERLWIEQRALEVCRPYERRECQERLDGTLRETARRGGVKPRPEPARRVPEVVATQWGDPPRLPLREFPDRRRR